MSSDGSYEKALDLLARRPHFRGELGRKLLQRGFAAAEVEETLDRLGEAGLLDDLEAARGRVAGDWSRRGYGNARIRAELIRRGVDDAVVERVLAERAGGELARAREAARKWLRSHALRPEALGRHLARKGYDAGTVYEVLESTRLEEPDLLENGHEHE